jgi:hypothetical protein
METFTYEYKTKLEVPMFANTICGFPVKSITEMSLQDLKNWLNRVEQVANASDQLAELTGVKWQKYYIVKESPVNGVEWHFDKYVRFAYDMQQSYALVRTEIAHRVYENDKNT